MLKFWRIEQDSNLRPFRECFPGIYVNHSVIYPYGYYNNNFLENQRNPRKSPMKLKIYPLNVDIT